MAHILIISDETLQRAQLVSLAQGLEHEAVAVALREALKYIQLCGDAAPEAILLDTCTTAEQSLKVLHTLHDSYPEIPVIMVNTDGDNYNSVRTTYMGAHDYINTPVTRDRLEVTLDNALRMRQMQQLITSAYPAKHIPLQAQCYQEYSKSWQRAIARAADEAHKSDTLIIEGEAGTGKTTLARAIHFSGPRAHKPFIVTDSGQDISELYSMLKHSHGGTLVVRHSGRAPEGFFKALDKLYHALSAEDIRLILCQRTSPSIHALELVERLITHTRPDAIILPPLKDRKEDIIPLAQHLLESCEHICSRGPLSLSTALRETLLDYDWPDNARELYITLFQSMMASKTSVIELPAHYAFPSSGNTRPVDNVSADIAAPHIHLMHEDGRLRSLEEIESEIIRYALDHCNASRSDIARMLGIGRTTLYRKVHQLHS